jgi:hypothetical protein
MGNSRGVRLTDSRVTAPLARSPDRLERLGEVPVVAFEIVGLVTPVPVEGVLDRHRDRGALGDGVFVVRVDAVDGDLDRHCRVADGAGAVQVVDVSRGVGGAADHDHAVAELEPGEHPLVVIATHPGFAAFGELEDAG